MGDEECSRRQKLVTNEKNIAQVYRTMLHDYRIKLRKMTEAVSISNHRMYQILTKDFDIKKLFASWMVRVLKWQQTQNHSDKSESLDVRFVSPPTVFCESKNQRLIITIY